MSALRRAELDEQEGDLGSARQRLVSYVVTTHYDGDVCERIARLCLRMGDLTEAGKWYFLCDSRDDEAPACISKFRQRHENDARKIASSLPKGVLADVRRGMGPEAVTRRLEETGAAVAMKPIGTARRASVRSRLADVGCLGVLVVLVVMCAIGVATVARWVLG